MTNNILLSVALLATFSFVSSCFPENSKCVVTTSGNCNGNSNFYSPMGTGVVVAPLGSRGHSSSVVHPSDVLESYKKGDWTVACYSKHVDDNWHFTKGVFAIKGRGYGASRYWTSTEPGNNVAWWFFGTYTADDCQNYISWTGESLRRQPHDNNAVWGGTRSRQYIIDIQPNVSKEALMDDNHVITHISCWEDEGLEENGVYVIYLVNATDKQTQNKNLEKAKEVVKKLTCRNDLGDLACIRNPLQEPKE